MFFIKFVFRRVATGILFAILLLLVQNTYAVSTISGIIYDKGRNALIDVDVELLNDYYQQIRRTKSDGSGRYTFEGLNDGRYSVRAQPFRYDLDDQTLPIEINTVDFTGTQGTSFNVVDFILLPRKGGLADAELGVIFAQEVPPDAKKSYDRALLDLAAGRKADGIMELNKSVEIFPNYYLALHRAGRELFMLRKYREAIPFLFKAAEINPKSATSFYYLGNSLHNLGKDYAKAAVASLTQAYTLAPGSAQVLYVLGRAERSTGNFANAEKYLLLAKKAARVSVPDIHKELAQLYANDMKKFSEAANELETYLKNSKPTEVETAQVKKVISDLRVKGKIKSAN